MVVAKSTGRSACATRVRGDLQVAAINAGATREGGVTPPTKGESGSLAAADGLAGSLRYLG